MRVAFVGLSSASGFLFNPNGRRADPRNPTFVSILESATGLATLFDEVWFIHEELCPPTMKHLSFVKLLNHDSELKRGFETQIEEYRELEDEERIRIFGDDEPSPLYLRENLRAALSKLTNLDLHNVPIDNHSHSIGFGDVSIQATPYSSCTLALDRAFHQIISKRNKRQHIELVANRATAHVLSKQTHVAVGVAHNLVIRRIPETYTYVGPELLEIDRVRESDALSKFREFVATETGFTEPAAVEELVPSIEDQLSHYRNTVLIEHQRKARVFSGMVRTVRSLMTGLLPVPGVGEAAELVNDMETRRFGWTTLLAELENRD